MRSWIPRCRGRLTPADFLFLADVLEREGQRGSLGALLAGDAAGVDVGGAGLALVEILDLEPVFLALLESPQALAVSPALYFYVLVRHSFRTAGIADAGLADYVADVLIQRLGRDGRDALRSLPGGMTRVADFVAIIRAAQGQLRFHFQVEAGNQFLVLTGLFPGFLARRCERTGAPGVDFYESFARQVFREAADNRDAPAGTSRQLLGDLAEALPAARRSLNRLAEELVFLGN